MSRADVPPAERTGAFRVRTAHGDAILATRVEPALGFWARFRGLMGRAALAPGTGIYLPDRSIHMMFMRFPIDALFVGAPQPGGERPIVAMRPDLPPWRGLVLPVSGATGVVELAAGSLAAAGVQPGDAVVFDPIEGPASG